MIAQEAPRSTCGHASTHSAYLAHIVFVEPLAMADYWAVIEGLSNAMPPAVPLNLLGDPLTDDPDSPPRGLLILPLEGSDRDAMEQQIREAAGMLPIHQIRLTQIRVRAEVLRTERP